MPAYKLEKNNRKKGEADLSINGFVDTILYRNQSNGYTVCGLDTNNEPVIAVGIMPAVSEGDQLFLKGNWHEHKQYGLQFEVKYFEIIVPQTSDDIFNFLASGAIKGIGPRLATRLIDAFGEDTLQVLTRQPQKTALVKGFSLRMAKEIAQQLHEKNSLHKLSLLLMSYNISNELVAEIFTKWQEKAEDKIRNNPYLLIDEFPHIDFKTIDRLALGLGVEQLDSRRLQNIVLYFLRLNLASGNTWATKQVLLRNTTKILDQEAEEDILKAIELLIKENKMMAVVAPCASPQNKKITNPKNTRVQINDNLGYMLTAVHRIEQETANLMLTHLQRGLAYKHAPSKEKILFEISKIDALAAKNQENQEIDYNELSQEQSGHLEILLSSPFSILTGGPGTGKTTLVKALCHMIKSEGRTFVLAAPTGRAARRLSEATGEKALTLHKLLELSFSDNFLDITKSYVDIKQNYIIVDESSMLDLLVFHSLIKAISPQTSLILVGDADQLPSVGPGQVLQDLISSQLIPVLRLNTIFRQSAQSMIVQNAAKIKQGAMPELSQNPRQSFVWIEKTTLKEMADATVMLCNSIIKKFPEISLSDLQVLTPIHKGMCGTMQLNERLQPLLNRKIQQGISKSSDEIPPKHYLQAEHLVKQAEPRIMLVRGAKSFYLADKVIQLKNRYTQNIDSTNTKDQDAGVMNGETGLIKQIDMGSRTMQVVFDENKKVEYKGEMLDDLELAYAITIHKSQGSEYPVVVLILPPTAPALLNRQLLYTALTRAKNKIYVISSSSIIKRMISNDKSLHRRTMLRYWLGQKNCI